MGIAVDIDINMIEFRSLYVGEEFSAQLRKDHMFPTDIGPSSPSDLPQETCNPLSASCTLGEMYQLYRTTVLYQCISVSTALPVGIPSPTEWEQPCMTALDQKCSAAASAEASAEASASAVVVTCTRKRKNAGKCHRGSSIVDWSMRDLLYSPQASPMSHVATSIPCAVPDWMDSSGGELFVVQTCTTVPVCCALAVNVMLTRSCLVPHRFHRMLLPVAHVHSNIFFYRLLSHECPWKIQFILYALCSTRKMNQIWGAKSAPTCRV